MLKSQWLNFPLKKKISCGMVTQITKKDPQNGMELIISSNGLRKKHIKCTFVYFFQSIEVILNAQHARGKDWAKNPLCGNGTEGLFLNYTLFL